MVDVKEVNVVVVENVGVNVVVKKSQLHAEKVKVVEDVRSRDQRIRVVDDDQKVVDRLVVLVPLSLGTITQLRYIIKLLRDLTG